MLGWHISICRLPGEPRDRGAAQRAAAEGGETRVMSWEVGLAGLDWIDEPVRRGDAWALRTNGYPAEYVAQGGAIREALGGGSEEGRDALAACPADEWLLVRAWDLS